MGPSKPRATNRPGEAASENEPVSPRNKADARLRGFALSCEIQCASRRVCIRHESLIEGKGKADNRSGCQPNRETFTFDILEYHSN